MFQIGENILVSTDLADRFFCCDLDVCHGACCIEGDSGAPLTEDERDEIQRILPELEPYLIEPAKKRIAEAGISYIDEEGDLVTELVDKRNCVFATRGDEAPCRLCLCAIEQANTDGKVKMRKPKSCALYPLRLTEYPTFTAVNYHRWDICRCAETKGKETGIRLYQFLEKSLRDRFGDEWYEELAAVCRLYLEKKDKGC